MAGLLMGIAAGCNRKSGDHRPDDGSATSSAAAQRQSAGTTAPPDDGNPIAGTNDSDSLTPRQVLQQVRDAYRSAKSYSDQGEVQLVYRENGVAHRDVAPLRVALSRPDKISIESYQLTLRCDGEKLRAAIEDEASHNFDQQVVVRDCPQPMTLETLFQDDASLQRALVSGLAGAPLVLELLLADEPLKTLFSAEAEPELLTEARLEGRPCFRVRSRTEFGDLVLWVDQQNYLVRRVQYPTSHIAAPDSGLEELELVADLKNARFDAPLRDSQFEYQPPQDAKLVTGFVPPPAQLSSDLFGKKPGEFELQTVDGQSVGPPELASDLAVLVWFQDHPACQAALQQLDQVRARFRGDDVKFYAIATDGAERSNDELQRLLKEWKVTVPLLRDPQSHGRDIFHIQNLPCLVVLDQQGVLHTFDIGYHPQLTEELPLVLKMLLEGQDVASTIRQRYELEQSTYAKALREAGWAGEGTAASVPEVKYPARTEPRRLKLRHVWSNDSIVQPGQLVLLPPTSDPDREQDGAASDLAVFTGMRSLALLEHDGTTRRVIELPLPDGRAASQMRATTANGKRFVALFETMGQQVYVVDEQWQTVFQYPESDLHHEGIRDACWSDLNGDGEPELSVGFWGEAGVHHLSLAGRRLWANRDCPYVQSVDTSNLGLPRLLVTGGSGRIHELGSNGRATTSHEVADWPIVRLYSGEPQASAPWLGFSVDPQGRPVALGLDARFRQTWNYSMPSGIYETPVTLAIHGRVGSQATWILVGPDGSIHVVAADGSFSDYFQYGEAITGIAFWEASDQPLLVVSTRQGVQAWQLDLPSTSSD